MSRISNETPKAAELIEKFSRAAWRSGELWEKHQGKGWPDAAAREFDELRDVRLPAIKSELLSLMAGGGADAPAEPSGDDRLSEALTEQRRRLCAETDAALTELARVRGIAKNALEFAEACLLARGWFEGNPDGALGEVEHRAKALLATPFTTSAEPTAPQEGGEREALKPCPFCGGKAEFDHDDDGWNWIECSQCKTSTKAATHSGEDCRPILSEAWNRRASLAAHPTRAELSDEEKAMQDAVNALATVHLDHMGGVHADVQQCFDAAKALYPFAFARSLLAGSTSRAVEQKPASGEVQPGQHTHADARLEKAQRVMDARFGASASGDAASEQGEGRNG